MEGLESIAMAVAHLEKVNADENSKTSSAVSDIRTVVPQTSADTHVPAEGQPYVSLPHAPISSAMPVPLRFPLGLSPRLVSDGSMIAQEVSSSSASSLSSSTSSFASDSYVTPASTPTDGLQQPNDEYGSANKSVVSNYCPPQVSQEASEEDEDANSRQERQQQQQQEEEDQQEKNTVPKQILDSILNMNLVAANCPPVPKLTDVIDSVQPDDVLCGRGGESNHNPGNVQYRQLVKACQPAYLAAKRRDKPRIAEGIVLAVRKLGGRFLKKDPNTNTWRDVGNSRAREKTSQALREGAPELRNTTTGSSSNNNNNNRSIPSKVRDNRKTSMMVGAQGSYVHHQPPSQPHAHMSQGNNNKRSAEEYMMASIHPAYSSYIPNDDGNKRQRTFLEGLADVAVIGHHSHNQHPPPPHHHHHHHHHPVSHVHHPHHHYHYPHQVPPPAPPSMATVPAVQGMKPVLVNAAPTPASMPHQHTAVVGQSATNMNTAVAAKIPSSTASTANALTASYPDTVPGDDDEEVKTKTTMKATATATEKSPDSTKKSTRGPRIKFFKKRLESDC